MVRTHEEAEEKIKETLDIITTWFEAEYPQHRIETGLEYSIDLQARSWVVTIYKDKGLQGKYVAFIHTEKMRTDPFWNDIFDKAVPSIKRAITRALEEPWEEPI